MLNLLFSLVQRQAKYLIILTSTYGEGEAPINASKFIPLLHKTQLKTSIKYAVIGLGSLAYPDYCKFAIDIENALLNINNFTPLLPLTKINNQNFSSFKLWILQFNKKLNSSLEVKQLITNPLNQESFTIIKITNINIDNTYLIRLKPHKKQHFSSGDLLAITPKKDNLKRLYSIGKIEDDILLSIKKHDLGICSNLLFNLQKNDILKAKIEKNKAFNLSIKTKEVILIANGTGIAPFLGMINRNHLITHVFWGIKTKQSIDVYKPYLKYNTINYVFSQEGNKEYVQDSIAKEEQLIINVLKNNGTIMICGSIAMMNQVLFIIESSIRSNLNTSLNKFRHQIKTDCY